MSEIRKALEAAGEAARASLASDTTCPQAGGYVCTTPPCSCASDAASAAVAAFLRALPDKFAMPGAHNPNCMVWGHMRGEMAKLANAVEAAAREANHG